MVDRSETYTFKDVRLMEGLAFRPLNIPAYIENEIAWSYIARFAQANGYACADTFLNTLMSNRYDKKWRRFDKWPYDLNRREADQLFRFADGSEWIAETTLYSALLLFRSPFSQAIKINEYAAENAIGRSCAIRSRNASDVLRLRACPKCMEEDREHGLFHYRSVHQMPGITVCPYHGCSLLQFIGRHGFEISGPVFEPVSVGDNAAPYADVCRMLLERRINGTAFDLGGALVGHLKSLLGCEGEGGLQLADEAAKSPLYGKHFGYGSRLSSLLSGRRLATIPFEDAVHFLIETHDRPEEFLMKLGRPDISSDDISALLGGRFALEGNDDGHLLRLRCIECGCDFPATAGYIKAGFGCPECDSRLSSRQVVERAIQRVAGEEWTVSNDFKTLTSIVRVASCSTGKAASMKLGSFLFGEFGEDDLYSEHELNKPALTNQEKIDRTKIKNEVETVGGFELIGFEGEGCKVKLILRHLECGREFTVFRTNFLTSPFCRVCGVDRSLKEDSLAAQVEEITGGRFSLVTGERKGIYKASDGSVSVSATSTSMLIEKLKWTMSNGEWNLDTQTAREAIVAYLSGRKGQLILLEDLRSVWPDSRFVSNYFLALKKRGVLESPSPGVYHYIGEVHSTGEIIDAKYGLHNGKRIGIPVCNSLVMLAGLCTADSYAYALPFAQGEKHHRKCTVASSTVDIFYIRCGIEEETWTTLAFLTTLKYSKFIIGWSGSLSLQLGAWAAQNGVSVESINRYAPFFTLKVLRMALTLVQQWRAA